jgi:hypothetical protein
LVHSSVCGSSPGWFSLHADPLLPASGALDKHNWRRFVPRRAEESHENRCALANGRRCHIPTTIDHDKSSVEFGYERADAWVHNTGARKAQVYYVAVGPQPACNLVGKDLTRSGGAAALSDGSSIPDDWFYGRSVVISFDTARVSTFAFPTNLEICDAIVCR